jgi:hypothetical protein
MSPQAHDFNVRAYLGVNDGDRYRYLSDRGATEVGFWQSSGSRRFGAIEHGAPFLFKSNYRGGAPRSHSGLADAVLAGEHQQRLGCVVRNRPLSGLGDDEDGQAQ